MQYSEDIFKNTITGSILLIDIRDVITLLPLQGEEELYLKLKTPSLNEKEDIIDFTEGNPFGSIGSTTDTTI